MEEGFKNKEIPEGWGGHHKPSGTEIPRGWGVRIKMSSVGGVWIFSGTTHYATILAMKAELCNGGATHTATELESCPCHMYRQLANNE